MDTVIVWFRRDLRTADNPALAAAAEAGRVLPVYIHAPDEEAPWAPGAASRWWLHHSLTALDAELCAIGSRLILRRGPSGATLRQLAAETGARSVYANRLYEPAAAARDRAVSDELGAAGITLHGSNAALFAEPWDATKPDGTPYRVFTAFWRARVAAGLHTRLRPTPVALPPPPRGVAGVAPESLGLRPTVGWDDGLAAAWRPGSLGAAARLAELLDRLEGYPVQRDRPALPGTSRLSPHLHFGEIGPRQVAAALEATADTGRSAALRAGAEAFVRQLGWRDFAHHLLWHFPHTPERPLDERFARFPWARDYDAVLSAWQRGETGIPLVDAGMRELWRTGWMHNRVRMIAASLLSKNLLVPWQAGARWFWETLVDADLANNTLGWQWVAGCGADAAPYFRVFNPVLQGERFDPRGEYVRHWVPELAGVPDRYVHRPWEAPVPPPGYPPPVVDLKGSRERALAAFRRI